MAQAIDRESDEWVRARKRVTDRRDFGTHLVVYLAWEAYVKRPITDADIEEELHREHRRGP